MCVVSFIGDHYQQKWNPLSQPITTGQGTITNGWSVAVTREEFDKLKEEVLEMKELLKKAKIYDEQNNEPNCEMEDKVAFLKKVAELVGVSLEDVFGK